MPSVTWTRHIRKQADFKGSSIKFAIVWHPRGNPCQLQLWSPWPNWFDKKIGCQNEDWCAHQTDWTPYRFHFICKLSDNSLKPVTETDFVYCVNINIYKYVNLYRHMSCVNGQIWCKSELTSRAPYWSVVFSAIHQADQQTLWSASIQLTPIFWPHNHSSFASLTHAPE